jgi:DNA mismatch repair protein MutS
MRVKEWKQDVVFLHEVGEGAGGRSWGVHVARLAGVPPTVVKRAAALLEALETRAGRMTEAAALPLFAAAAQNNVETDTATSQTPDPLRVAVEAIDPDLLTPREALEALYRLRSLVTVAQGDEAIT